MKKRYPAYKESGITWIGEIPAHWTVSPLKHVARVNQEALTENTDENYEIRYVDIGNVTQEGLIAPPAIIQFGDAPSRARRIVRSGDTIVSTVRTYLKAIAYFPCTEENLIASTGFAVLTPTEKMFPKLLHYLVSSQQTIEAITANSVGVSYPAINSAELAAIPVAFPTNQIEQQAIADYLDRKTAAIDTLIAKKERQIELLQEQRAAVVNQAVTRGLNPDAPMKGSGIEWIGRIPVHWNTGKLQYVSTTLQTGPFGSQLHFSDYVENGIPIVNPSNIQNGRIVPDWGRCVSAEIFARLSRHRLDEGDIVFGRRGEMGRCALVTEVEDGWLCGTGSIKVSLNKEIVFPAYINLLLTNHGIRDWLSLQSVGSTMDNLNTSIIAQIPIPLLPVTEQIAIVQFIEKKTSLFDRTIGNNLLLIEKLKEYRTAVISAAITGRIDVRNEI